MLSNYKSAFPLVSVLIPMYNSESTIEECIRSVLGQTYPNIEIVVIDDGSTDNSIEVVNTSFKKEVILKKCQNKGACVARNTAFEISQGSFIQYLDADDVLGEDKINLQMSLLNQVGGMEVLSSCIWGRFACKTDDVKWEHKSVNKDYDNPIMWLIDSWEGKGMAQTSVWLTPRNLIEKAGPWKEQLRVNQDGEFFSRVLSHAKEIKYCDDARVFYRSGNKKSISNEMNELKAKSLLDSYIMYVENMKNQKLTDQLRHALMRNFLNFYYRFYEQYPDLIALAKEQIRKLGYKKLEVTGGKIFKEVASIIGFENTLRIRKITRKMLGN